MEASRVVARKGLTPGTVMVVFYAYDEVDPSTPSGQRLAEGRATKIILQDVSLLEVVETVANSLFTKMLAAGFMFSGVVGGAKKRRKRKRN